MVRTSKLINRRTHRQTFYSTYFDKHPTTSESKVELFVFGMKQKIIKLSNELLDGEKRKLE